MRLAAALLLAMPLAALGEETAVIKPWYLSVTTGLPLPVGGLLGLEYQRRFDRKQFARVAVGSSLVVSGVSVSYGQVYEPGTFWLVGLDTAVVLVEDYGDGYTQWFLPGAHAAWGWEWFTDQMRLALELNVGFPWLGGLRFSAGI